MNKKHLFYIGIILFPFFVSQNAVAQDGVRRQRHMTVNQTIVDGKIIRSDTIILEADTVRQRTVQSKEISMELPYTKGTTVHIDNAYRKINIRQSTDNKVRLSTTAFYYTTPTFANEQWFEKLNIGMKNSDTGIVITSSGRNRSAGSNAWEKYYGSSYYDTVMKAYQRVNPLYDTARKAYQRIDPKGWSVTQNGASQETKIGGTTVTQNGAFQKTTIGSGSLKGMTITRNGAFEEVKHNGMTITQNGAYRKVKIDSGTLKGTTVIQNGASQTYTSGVPDAPTPPEPPAASSPSGAQGSRTINGTNINGRAISDGTFTTGNWSNSGNVVTVFDAQGNAYYNSTSLKADLTIYLPAGAKLDVTTKYADVSVDHDVNSIKANIIHASLDMLNATDATIKSNYGTISAGNFTTVDIASTSGKIFVKDVAQLQLNTRYTKVEAGVCGLLKTQSISDDYDIDEVKNFDGQKTYGNLRIDKLTGSFSFKGTNADLKIRNIEPSVSAITIENKYADVRLPVASLKNYEVNFSGNYSSISAPFERREDTAQSNAGQSRNGNTSYSTSNGDAVSITGSSFPSRNRTTGFTASVGDIKGTHTAFKLNCISCQVSFR